MINFLQSLSPVAFNLGPFSVRWYGIIIMTGVIVAVLMATSEAKKNVKLCLMILLICFSLFCQ